MDKIDRNWMKSLDKLSFDDLNEFRDRFVVNRMEMLEDIDEVLREKEYFEICSIEGNLGNLEEKV